MLESAVLPLERDDVTASAQTSDEAPAGRKSALILWSVPQKQPQSHLSDRRMWIFPCEALNGALPFKLRAVRNLHRGYHKVSVLCTPLIVASAPVCRRRAAALRDRTLLFPPSVATQGGER